MSMDELKEIVGKFKIQKFPNLKFIKDEKNKKSMDPLIILRQNTSNVLMFCDNLKKVNNFYQKRKIYAKQYRQIQKEADIISQKSKYDNIKDISVLLAKVNRRNNLIRQMIIDNDHLVEDIIKNNMSTIK